MKIGRLLLEKPDPKWISIVGGCGCVFISTKYFLLTWFAKDCKCVECKKYVCICKEKS